MTKLEQLYTCGIWLVKEGKEEEFAETWENFAQWTIEYFSTNGAAMLLQDIDHPRKFVSYGPWESRDQISTWRETSEFQAFAENAKKLCDEFEPLTMRVAGQTG